ncbi:MAG: hypothetical protein EBS23_08075 [Betaproteobacteria bacterium]|nr:hypothetical protein [Betaproteobacteria bacterium]
MESGMDVEYLHTLVSEYGRGVGHDDERRAMRCVDAYLACLTHARALHAALVLQADNVSGLAGIDLRAEARELALTAELLLVDVPAFVAQLGRYADQAANVADGNDGGV